ncbi:hypothetical protein AN958_11031 [Leucoagaricus sp. SymC.cos]|nr:hypothetical protein AN958_11031 [Leucoagaricus sp. SymC.cos]
MALTEFLLPLVIAALCLGLFKLYGIFHRELTSPIRRIRGPRSNNFVTGLLRDIMFVDQSVVHAGMIQEYGTTFKFRSLMWKSWLYTADVKAVSHVLKRDTGLWQKPMVLGYSFQQVLGRSVLLVDSDVHRSQRKVLNPAFAPAEIKKFTETFLDKAAKLRDIWADKVQQSGNKARIDVLSWISKVTLDVIGETGFGYKFDSLKEETSQPNELHLAFQTAFRVEKSPGLIRLLRGLVPVTRYLPIARDKEFAGVKQKINDIGRQLLNERKLLWETDYSEGATPEGKDVLSLLVKANMSEKDSIRLSDEHVLAQIPTFTFAGHETTAVGTTWTLFALAQDQSVQSRLREELLKVPTESPTMEELDALPYLDAVIREALRLHSPVPATIRYATKDDVIPLQNPIIDEDGKEHYELKVNKGQVIYLSITMVNRLESIWGEDAQVFNPDRWTSPPEAAANIPGVWGNIMSFLGGPRNCIGWRFALVEIKAILFTLLRTFKFEMAVPAKDILKRSELVMRPILRTDPNGHNQLPLIVQPITV